MHEKLQYHASMTFRDVVAQQEHNLSASDQQVIQVLLSDPATMAFLSAAEIAERVGVHESTVVRLAKKLGYEGYKELRNDLRQDIAPAERMRRRLASTNELSALIAEEIATLQDLVNTISQAQLDEVALKIIAARRIYLFAQGHSTALVDLMDRRLRRYGFDTVVLRYQRRDLAEHLMTLGERDVVLAFAFRVRPPGLSALLKYAARIGATTIVISDMLGVLLRPQPDLLLAARRGAEDQYLTLTVPMAICNALILTIARLDEGRSIERLDRLSDLIQFFDHEDQE